MKEYNKENVKKLILELFQSLLYRIFKNSSHYTQMLPSNYLKTIFASEY